MSGHGEGGDEASSAEECSHTTAAAQVAGGGNIIRCDVVTFEATRHLRVRKSETEGRTRTVVEWLDADERVSEVADMISGGAAEATALAEARRLLGV